MAREIAKSGGKPMWALKNCPLRPHENKLMFLFIISVRDTNEKIFYYFTRPFEGSIIKIVQTKAWLSKFAVSCQQVYDLPDLKKISRPASP